MTISSWFCSNNTRNMLVKIVHPGGHVELHDRPITAADIIRRNPRCCVAYPNVFKQPWAIVPPDTNLMPGQKFYVVPISTIRKLQRLSKKYSPVLLQEIETIQNAQSNKATIGGKVNNNGRKESKTKGLQGFCTCLGKGMKIKARNEEITLSNSCGSSSSEKNLIAEKRHNNDLRVIPKRLSSFYQWQPGLESITEE